MLSPTRLLIVAVLVCVAGLMAYLPGVNGPLLFDDKPWLTANRLVQIDGTTADEWRTAALSSHSGPLRRPLAMLSFAANYALAGDFSPQALKAVNILIHFCVGLLLYLFFMAIVTSLKLVPELGTRRLLALTAAAIWLLHPLNVSTVLYTIQRMTQLSMLFVVLGLCVFMHYRQRWAEAGSGPGEVIASGLWLLLLTALAALSKENGALLPWLIVALEVSVFRGAWAGRTNRQLRAAGWIVLVAPIVLLVLIFLFSPERLQAGFVGREFTLQERLLTQPRLLWRYLGWICFPNINDMGFHHDDIPWSTGLQSPVTTVLALTGWLSLLLGALFLRNRFPLLLLATLFFLIGHSMESSVLPLEMVYEHRNYLPGILLCLALAYVIVIPASRSTRLSVWYPVSGALIVLCFLLFVRVQTWSDEMTLSRVNLVHHPESPRANHMYGNALVRHIQDEKSNTLSERERRESLLVARHYFERMYQTDDRDVAALVMLLYLDSHFFTQLQGQVDWLSSLDELLKTRRLQPTDWNALSLFFDLADTGTGMASEAQVAALLELLQERYPNSADSLRYRHQYLSRGGQESAQLLPLLQRAQNLAPRSDWVYRLLLSEQASNGDVPGMYESARLWLLHDPNRYHVNQLKPLFGEADPATGSSDD